MLNDENNIAKKYKDVVYLKGIGKYCGFWYFHIFIEIGT